MPRSLLLSGILLTWAIGASCGRKARIPEFPIGLFGVEQPADLPALREAGFTAIQSYAGDPAALAALAAAARRTGIRTVLPPTQLMKSIFSARGFQGVTWYLADEPDVHKTPPEDLARLERQVNGWDPDSPTTFVVGHGGSAAKFAHVGDVIMVDWYPVPHLPLTSAGDHVRRTVESAGGKPVWAVLQAMDWRSYSQRDPRKKRIGRFPNANEIRFMSYHSILEGASGLWYFTYTTPSRKTLSEFPELWFALTRVTREISALRPILVRGREIAPPFSKAPPGVLARAWRYRMRNYVVVLNRGSEPAQLPDALLDADWRPLFEPRRRLQHLLEGREDEFYLKPYRVLVLESRFGVPFQAKSAEQKLARKH